MTMYDQIGPGTPAWRAFDNALAAWKDLPPKGPERWTLEMKRKYKRYHNYRLYMIRLVRTIKGAIEARKWTAELNRQKDDPYYQEN
jgi:hypothetical protein